MQDLPGIVSTTRKSGVFVKSVMFIDTWATFFPLMSTMRCVVTLV